MLTIYQYSVNSSCVKCQDPENLRSNFSSLNRGSQDVHFSITYGFLSENQQSYFDLLVNQSKSSNCPKELPRDAPLQVSSGHLSIKKCKYKTILFIKMRKDFIDS